MEQKIMDLQMSLGDLAFLLKGLESSEDDELVANVAFFCRMAGKKIGEIEELVSDMEVA